MRRTGSRNLKVGFSAGQLTHFGGIVLLHQFLQQLQVRTFLSRKLHLSERNNRFSLTERLFALLYPMLLGLDRIESSALLKTNGVFQHLTGLPRFPNPTTLRRFLMSKKEELLPRFRLVHDRLRSHFLLLPQTPSSLFLDFDSTARTLYGKQEGVLKGYNPGRRGKKSYHPLICTEAHRRDCLGGELRYGNAYTAEGVVPLFERVFALLPTGFRLRARADAGFYEGDFVDLLGQKKVGFAVVARLTRPLQHRLAGLRYQRSNETKATAEFFYHPQGWKNAYRFVALRERLTEKRREQLKLFIMDAYAYHVIVTNLDLTPYGVFAFYEDRSGMERIVRTLKEDYPFGLAPTKSFAANALYTELSLFAYNLIIWFKRLCLPAEWQSYTVDTLRHKLLWIPGVFTRTDNRPSLKLPKSHPYRDVFVYAQERIHQLKPLGDFVH